MIRDPSDGTVRETAVGIPATEIDARCSGSTSVSKTEGDGSIPSASASGLAPDHSSRTERLQKSRDWLAEYRAKKGKTE